ncbi:hypothetical protein ZWY2020_051868 [Hordeum vulgare]|nr:hypothetical protein ZWY2020_051868 [Hordeum vulgare]
MWPLPTPPPPSSSPSESDASPLPVPSPPPPAAASRATSPPPSAAAAGPTPPPPAAAAASRSPPVPCTPPPAAASTGLSPLVPWTPPPAAASTSRSPPVLPRRTYTPINLPDERRRCSRAQPPRCEDTEQAVRIEAPPSPDHFPPVSALRPTRLLIKYFLRVDAGGLFHTYPHRGGPFKTLQEAQDAIDSYHTNLCKFKYLGGLSNEDRFVWDTLYWRNGTRKNSKEALDAMMNYNPTWEVVKALLDKHNEDHPLEDLAYEIKEVVSYKDHFPRKDSQHECRSFSHLNVLVERGPNAIKDLLFIEMTCTTDGGFEEYVLSCISVISSDDDGECCECGDDVKHPTGAEYKKGVAKGRVQCGRPISREEFNEFIVVRDEDWLEAEEAMVRHQFRTFDIADGHGARGKYIIPAERVQA